jgi:hypothetical protein
MTSGDATLLSSYGNTRIVTCVLRHALFSVHLHQSCRQQQHVHK